MCGNPIDTIGTTCSRCGALQTLGLEGHASYAQIQDTYMTLVKVWHPDRFQTDPRMGRAAEEKLKEINAAYDYLRGKAPATPPDRPDRQAPPRRDAAPRTFTAASSPETGELEEVTRVLKRLKKQSRPKTLIKVMFALGGLAAAGLVVFSLDLFLSANSNTSRGWDQFKAEISQDLRAKRLLPSSVTETQAPKDENPPATNAPVTPVSAPAAKARNPSGASAAATAKPSNGVKPYLTSGLTTTEVLSLLGNPTSSAGEKMFYKGSEIDFKDGRVAGWKIDRAAPIRVKLWPAAAPAPGLTTFAVGSSKSDVIAVQGTPTLFSDNKFGYGGSIVFFQNDRVTGWQQDQASVRLRVAP